MTDLTRMDPAAPLVALALIPSMVMYWDARLHCRFANRACEDFYGRSCDELLGLPLQVLLGDVHFAEHLPHVQAALAGTARRITSEIRSPEGTVRCTVTHYVPHRDAQGQVQGLVAHQADVSDLHQPLQRALQLCQIGRWTWDIASDAVSWSEQIFQHFGLDPAAAPPPFAAHRALFSPAGWLQLKRACTRVVRGGGPFLIEAAFLDTQNVPSLMEVRGAALHDDTGRLAGVHGTMHKRPGAAAPPDDRALAPTLGVGHARAQASGAVPVAPPIRHPSLRALYNAWQAARTGQALPALDDLNLSRLALTDHVFVGEVTDIAPFTLETRVSGAALQRGLDGHTPGHRYVAGATPVFAGWEPSYRRSVRLREASLEWLHLRCAGLDDLTFERLLLPCADHRGHRHHLVGLLALEDHPGQPGLCNPRDLRDEGSIGTTDRHLARPIETLSDDAIDALPFGVVRLDAQGTVVYTSPGEARRAGLGDRTALGQHFFGNLAPCMDQPQIRSWVQAGIRAGTFEARFVQVGDTDPRECVLWIQARPSRDGGVWLFLHRR